MTDDPGAVSPHKLIADLVEGVGAAPAEGAGDDAPPFSEAGAAGGDGKKPPVGGVGVDGMEPDNARDEIDRLNREWSLVLMGSRAVVMRETPDAPIEDRTRVLSLDAFKAYLQNRRIRREREVVDEKTGETVVKTTYQQVAPLWLSSRERRTYDGVEFFPDPDNRPGSKNYFNLWRGFDVKPAFDLPKKERLLKYSVFHDHLRVNICNGDERVFEWMFGWLAHIVQRPRERLGIAIVLRGGEGWGKTIIGKVVGSLFGSHYFLVDDPRYLVGQFNAHMASCLLLQVDEGFWAGDKAAEGRLKGLITSDRQMIEAKGIDPIRLDNYVRLLFSSNEEWVVPVGLDGRRFVVLDVSPAQARNAVYFGELEKQMNEGGREALLADLLTMDLDALNLRDPPKTRALLEQKTRSLDSVTAWWYERLQDGALTRRRTGWASEKGGEGYIAVDTLFDDYVHNAEKVGVRRKAEKTALGMRLTKLLKLDGVGLLQPCKRTMSVELPDGSSVMRRVPCYHVPDLATCRAAYEQAVGQSVEWLFDHDDRPPDDDDAGAGERGEIGDDF